MLLPSPCRVVKSEVPLRDVLEGSRVTCPVHEHGFVTLVDAMPRLVPEGRTCDYAIAQAARTSTGQDVKTVEEDRSLIRYLYRHRHTSPFEQVEFKWHMRMPIFVARQFIRHRTANVNEFSGRYAVMPDLFYRPDRVYRQSATNKQGSGAEVEWGTADEFMDYLARSEAQYATYQKLVDEKDVSREIARIGLPLSLYTEWYWKNDLHNTLHFLSLRCDKHAQKEIRDFADPMLAMIGALCPDAVEAFNDYHPYRDAVLLTRLEVEAMRHQNEAGWVPEIQSTNKRERAEWHDKAARFGLRVIEQPV